jgi:hypothetical protein
MSCSNRLLLWEYAIAGVVYKHWPYLDLNVLTRHGGEGRGFRGDPWDDGDSGLWDSLEGDVGLLRFSQSSTLNVLVFDNCMRSC